MSEVETLLRRSLQSQASNAPAATPIEEEALLRASGEWVHPDKQRSPGQSGRWVSVVGAAVAATIFVITAVALRNTGTATNSAGNGEVMPQLTTSGWTPGADSMMVAINGKLRVAKNGCIYLEGRGGSVDVAWPAGWSARAGEHGAVYLLDDSGRVVAESGDRVHTGGGGYPEEALECHATAAAHAVSINGPVTVIE